MFLSRILMSVADASFWLLIIGGTGLTIWLVFQGIIGCLMKDVKEEEDKE